MDERKEFTNGLRQIADWFDAHHEVELPSYPDISFCATDTREAAAATMLALKPCNKGYTSNIFTLSHYFGSVLVKFLFYRDAVCVRKVVGSKDVPEEVIPGKVIPAHTEEIVEWECEPILGQRDA